MNNFNRIRHYGLACLSMAFGTFLVFFVVIFMNEAAQGPTQSDLDKSTGFEIVKQETPEPKKIVRREQPEPRPRQTQPLSPLVGLDTALSGIAFDLPAFSLDALNPLQGGVLGENKDVVMTGESVDVPPRPAYQAPVQYPLDAKAQGIEGYVLLSVLIDANGEVERVKVLEAKPDGVFEKVAVHGVQNWRFRPAKYQGKQVRVWAKQKVRFDLS